MVLAPQSHEILQMFAWGVTNLPPTIQMSVNLHNFAELYRSLQYTSLLNLAIFLMLKPFKPNIHIQILQTDLYTSPLRIG